MDQEDVALPAHDQSEEEIEFQVPGNVFLGMEPSCSMQKIANVTAGAPFLVQVACFAVSRVA